MLKYILYLWRAKRAGTVAMTSRLKATDYYSYIKSVATKVNQPAARTGFKRKLDAFVESDAGLEKVPGDARVKKILKTLDMFEGYIRSPSQREFHLAFLHACLPHIYGNIDFENNRERILRDNGLTDLDYEILVCCS